jgi:hypothetical protein
VSKYNNLRTGGIAVTKKPKPQREQDRRITELQDQLKERDERIKELRRELGEAEELVSEEREYIEQAMATIDAWKEAFGMVQDEKGVWRWDEWMDRWTQMNKTYDAVVTKWNRFVGEYNEMLALVLKRKRNVGRPLGADEAQVAQVRKLRKAGRSLRGIEQDTGLALATVRTIVDRDDGGDRMTKRRWQKLHPGERWEERSYTPVGKLARIDPRQFKEEPWRVRTRASLPKRINETLERGAELVKAAKGLR